MEESAGGTEIDELVQPALAAAHRALNRLEPEDVPAALRPVRAASMKRTLPPPLRKTLMVHLDELWLRTLALEELGAGESRADVASHLFLVRDAGWKEALAELASADVERSQEDRIASLERDLARERRKNDELSRRLAEAERRAQGAIDADQAHRRADEMSGRITALRRRIRELEATLDQHAAESRRLAEHLAEADDRIAYLRSRLGQGGTAEQVGSETGHMFGRGTPEQTARMLDGLMEALRPSPDAPPHEPVEPERLALPVGVSPDSAEAIDWLLTLRRRLVLVVDGHNVAHDLAIPGRSARDRVVAEVARLRRLADGPIAAIVFFDTSHAAEAHANFGVSVRYVADADDAIEAFVAQADAPTVVVSTDKEVRERARAHGSIGLWGLALSRWIQRR
ncbi:MAG: hypothetical protein ACLGHX_14385 [Acidimicrobiia bacterium]